NARTGEASRVAVRQSGDRVHRGVRHVYFDLRRVAGRAEAGAVFYLRPALMAGMLHRLKVKDGSSRRKFAELPTLASFPPTCVSSWERGQPRPAGSGRDEPASKHPGTVCITMLHAGFSANLCR